MLELVKAHLREQWPAVEAIKNKLMEASEMPGEEAFDLWQQHRKPPSSDLYESAGDSLNDFRRPRGWSEDSGPFFIYCQGR
jgi:hypothetical protein